MHACSLKADKASVQKSLVRQSCVSYDTEAVGKNMMD